MASHNLAAIWQKKWQKWQLQNRNPKIEPTKSNLQNRTYKIEPTKSKLQNRNSNIETPKLKKTFSLLQVRLRLSFSTHAPLRVRVGSAARPRATSWSRPRGWRSRVWVDARASRPSRRSCRRAGSRSRSTSRRPSMRKRRRRSRITIATIYSGDQRLLSTHKLIHLPIN